MSYVPVFVPPQPSRKSRELAKALARLAAEYQQREGSMSHAEIRMALSLASAELTKGRAGDHRRLSVILALGVALLLVAGILVLAFTLR